MPVLLRESLFNYRLQLTITCFMKPLKLLGALRALVELLSVVTVGKNFGGPSHLHSHSQGTHTIHNGINSHSYNTKGERVEREEERTYCIVFIFYTLVYN